MHANDAGLVLIAEQVTARADKVFRTLGAGFPERAYQNALELELRTAGFAVTQKCTATIRYDGAVVGEYPVGLLVEGQVLVGVRAAGALDDFHQVQCERLLNAGRWRMGLLINFGKTFVSWVRLAPAQPALQAAG